MINEKKLSKEYCKDMPWAIKCQCWFKRNRKWIAKIAVSLVGGALGAILTMQLLWFIIKTKGYHPERGKT